MTFCIVVWFYFLTKVSRHEVDVNVLSILSYSALLVYRALKSQWWTVPYKVAGIPYLSGKDPSNLVDHLQVSRTSPCCYWQ